MKAGSFRINLDHRQQRRERLLEREPVPELLLDEVTDHPLGLGPQHVERRLGHLPVCRFLQGEQPDLRAVAVRDDQLMLLADRRQMVTRQPGVCRADFPRSLAVPGAVGRSRRGLSPLS